MAKVPTMSSHGRWFGWSWSVPCPNNDVSPGELTIALHVTGYSFTQWGARRAIRGVLRRQRRERTIEVPS